MGNPSSLLKNGVISKGIHSILSYLRDRHPDTPRIDAALTSIKATLESENPTKIQNPKQPEFLDPFKAKPIIKKNFDENLPTNEEDFRVKEEGEKAKREEDYRRDLEAQI